MAENSIIDEIQTINGIPLCDKEARSKVEEVKTKMEQLENYEEHKHDQYITREEVTETYVTKLEVESALEKFELSDYVTKKELANMNFLTELAAVDIFASIAYVDSQINTIKSELNTTLQNYATITYANEINDFAKSLENRIIALETEHKTILAELEALKNKKPINL